MSVSSFRHRRRIVNTRREEEGGVGMGVEGWGDC